MTHKVSSVDGLWTHVVSCSNNRYLLSTYYMPDAMLDNEDQSEPSAENLFNKLFSDYETGSCYAAQAGWPPTYDLPASAFLKG